MCFISPLASLARFFSSKNGQRSEAHRARFRRALKRRSSFTVEPLEPRLLLDAAPLVFNVDPAAAANFTVQVANADVQIVDNSSGNILLSQALADTSEVIVHGSSQVDTLTVDATAAASSLPIAFDGNAGDDTLRGPSLDSEWHITGSGAGSVGSVAFTGVENLTGAADNEDTFIFTAPGSLSGLLEGGDAGFDSIILDGTGDSVIYRFTGPQSGSIERFPGNIIEYDGFEPISSKTPDPIPSNPTDVTLIYDAPGTLRIS